VVVNSLVLTSDRDQPVRKVLGLTEEQLQLLEGKRRGSGSALNLKPDGLLLVPSSRTIYIIEVARTSDNREHFDAVRENEKERHYHVLVTVLPHLLEGHSVKRLTFIMGARGSFRVELWEANLSELGIPRHKQKPILVEAVRSALQGLAFVMKVWRQQQNSR